VKRPAALLLALALLPAPAAFAQSTKKSATPNRFGAIAYHHDSHSWGVAYDFPRARDAHEHALRQCINPKCEVVHRFRNGCAALAAGSKQFAAASGVTRAEADTKASRRCGEKNRDKSCELLAWACTR
jgi:hypothetical protein